MKIPSNQHKAITGLLLLLLMSAVAQDASEAGLYPSIQFTVNLATQQPISATSTCSSTSCISGGCRVCNASCPHGADLPSSIDLLTVGTPASGVVSQQSDKSY